MDEAPPLPGYRYDPNLKRYFKLEHPATGSRQATAPGGAASAGQQEEENARPAGAKRGRLFGRQEPRDVNWLMARNCRGLRPVWTSEAFETPVGSMALSSPYPSFAEPVLAWAMGDGSLQLRFSRSRIGHVTPHTGRYAGSQMPHAVPLLEEASANILAWNPTRPLLAATVSDGEGSSVECFAVQADATVGSVMVQKRRRASTALAWLSTGGSFAVFGPKSERPMLYSLETPTIPLRLPSCSGDTLSVVACLNGELIAGLRSGSLVTLDPRSSSPTALDCTLKGPVEWIGLNPLNGHIVAYSPSGIHSNSLSSIDLRRTAKPIVTFGNGARPGNVCKPCLKASDVSEDVFVFTINENGRMAIYNEANGECSATVQVSNSEEGAIRSFAVADAGSKVGLYASKGVCVVELSSSTD